MICPACRERYARTLRAGVTAAPARYAGFWIRFVAVIIDGIILLVVGGIVQVVVLGSFTGSLPTVDAGTPPEEMAATFMGALGLAYLLNTVIGCTYEAVFISQMSAMPGKMALGLKVLRPDGTKVSLARAIGRYFAKLLSAMIMMIGYIIAGFDSQKRALHDMICDTRVIKSSA
jgi:uncharacterized RDD family membrane protein YckC